MTASQGSFDFKTPVAFAITFVIGQLQTAQDLHQIVNLTSCASPTRFKVLLQTQTRKESQDHTG